MDYNFESLYAEERQEWEPVTPFEWPNRDPLRRALQKAEIQFSAKEQDLISFHAAYMRCPPGLRAQIFREREIAASPVLLLPQWRAKLPSLFSVGVGKRAEPEPRLCAVVTVETPLTPGEVFKIQQDWARVQGGESSVPEYRESGQAKVPIYVDVRPEPTLFGQVPAGNFLFCEPDPTPANAPVVQSGDRIGSESPAGVQAFGTLACLVSLPGSSEPLALSSGHVFVKAQYRLVTKRGGTSHIGDIKAVNMDCDAAIATLQPPYLCDYRLKVSDLIPAAPVIPSNDLTVQLHGAISGTQTGFLNQVNVILANARAVTNVPLFTANITCARGDSGALLVTGIGKEPPALAWQRKFMAPAYLESMTCAILGVLMAGPLAGADPMVRPQAYFYPAVQIFNDLGVEAWVR